MKYLNMANPVQFDQRETLFTMLDLSGSMYTGDIKPNRKEAGIKANNTIVQEKQKAYPDDEIGVICFERTAKLSLIPTCAKDIDDLSKVIDDTGLTGGTNFTAPLTLAYNYFAQRQTILKVNPILKTLSRIFLEQDNNIDVSLKNNNTTKRIILLTDGEHLGKSNPVNIADKLKEIGVIIDCIGIGGSPKDVDEELLKQIASRNPDGSIRYCFIGDQEKLLRKYSSLAHHLKVV
jgi:hypothetical protein